MWTWKLGPTVVAVGALTGLAACRDAPSPTAPAARAGAPSFSAAPAPIAGSYIVVFRPDVADPSAVAQELASTHAGKLKFVYRAVLKGAAFALEPAAAARLASDPRVAAVEQDQEARAVGVQAPTPSWGLDRLDQRALPLDNSYTYTNDGTGVTVYIIDTGINFTHTDLGGRAVKGVDEVTSGGTAADCNGHGTHVSGTVGGTSYGVAKNVRLVAVRVLDCSGSGAYSGVIAGVDWVTADVQKAAGDPTKVGGRPASANMSLGGGYSATMNQAVENSIAAGVTYAVAAGNSSADACVYSPASAPNALTVGATDNTDTFAYFSNYGSCVDIHGPGVGITSAWIGSNTATNTISGTSMAAPHVAGAAALYQYSNPTATPAQVAAALTGNATSGVIRGLPAGTVNLLLYSLSGGNPPPPPPPPSGPKASFTYSCSGFTCNFTNTSTGATSYLWNFGDGSTSAEVNPSYTFGRRTNYTVKLTAQDASGRSSSTSQVISCNQKRCV